MKFLIDDARIDEIKKIYECFPVSGVTTNPTILSKVGGNPFDTLKEIRNFIGEDADLHVQAVSRRAEKIVDEARHIVGILGSNTYVKIPAIPEGFKAMKILVDTRDSVHGDRDLYANASFYRGAMRCELCGSLRQQD